MRVSRLEFESLRKLHMIAIPATISSNLPASEVIYFLFLLVLLSKNIIYKRQIVIFSFLFFFFKKKFNSNQLDVIVD